MLTYFYRNANFEQNFAQNIYLGRHCNKIARGLTCHKLNFCCHKNVGRNENTKFYFHKMQFAIVIMSVCSLNQFVKK